MSFTVQGLGTAVPEHSIEQAEAATIAKEFVYANDQCTRVLPALFRRTRVQRRGSVLLESANGSGLTQSFFPTANSLADRGPGTEARMNRYTSEAVPLALTACRRALTDAALEGDAITHLVTVSCTGFSSPGVDFALIRRLGLPPTVGRVNVGFMGCHGALNGLRVAKAFGDSDASAKVLLCSVELCSLHYQYGSKPQQMVANALFSDGAAALVATDNKVTPNGNWKIESTGTYLIPDAEDAMTWRIGDHGFEMTLSPNVPDLIAKYLRPWMSSWLRSHGLTLEAVRSWAVHPGGPKILQSVQAALRLPVDATEASTDVLRDHGNMSSATTLFVIERLQRSRSPLPCVALGFGPGLVCEAALFV